MHSVKRQCRCSCDDGAERNCVDLVNGRNLYQDVSRGNCMEDVGSNGRRSCHRFGAGHTVSWWW